MQVDKVDIKHQSVLSLVMHPIKHNEVDQHDPINIPCAFQTMHSYVLATMDTRHHA